MTAATIRWGIAGSGRIARLFAEDLARLPDARLTAVASRTPERARELARDFAAPRVHASVADLAADPTVDVVYVASTNDVHREHAVACLDAGKAVLCEKPFTRDAREARDVVAAARRRGAFCMEAMWTRFLPAVREARALVAHGAIGDLRLITAQLAVPIELEAIPRLARPELGGGALLDVGIYPVSFASHFLGAPSRVVSLATLADTGVDDQAGAVLAFAGGRLATIATTVRGRGAFGAELVGTRGAIRFDAPLYRPTGFTLVRGEGDESTRVEPPLEGRGFHLEAAEVMRCLRAGEPESPTMPLDESVAIMEAMDAMRAQWSAASPEA